MKILNTIISTAYKTALGIPKGTGSPRLLDLGVHNTIEEIIEADNLKSLKQAAQLWGISCSAQGHKILEAMNLHPVAGITDRICIPNSIRSKIIIPPFPKKHGSKQCRQEEGSGRRLSSKLAIYVDTALESAHTFTIAAPNNEGQTVSSRKISAGSIHGAEEAAIALGIAASRYSFIILDSMSAIRRYMQGSVGPRASEILSEPAGKVTIIWMPAQSGNGGTEMAHRAARELINQEVEACPRPLPGGTTPSHTYNEIVTAYSEYRRIYPPPDSSLSRMQATDLRRAQTGTVMSPKIISYIS